jgi:hypothetical protein
MKSCFPALPLVAVLALAAPAWAGEPAPCAPGETQIPGLKTPLIKRNDDAVDLAKAYFATASSQSKMFDKRRYAFDVVRAGETWSVTITWMRRPRYFWEDWKRAGRVGKVNLCGLDGRLMGIEVTY